MDPGKMPPPSPGYGGEYNPGAEERTIAMWSHLGTAIANVVTGVGWVVALVIYLVKRESRFIAFHALQQLFLQIALFVITLGCVIVTFVSLGACCFLLFVPIGLGLAALVYSIIVGLKANEGVWMEFPLVGKWAKDTVLKAPPPASPGAQPPTH